MRLGFLGLGNMGRPMAENLLRAGFDLTVWSRTAGKAAALAGRGAKEAASPADLARRVDLVLTCLADVPAVREVFLGEEGVLAAARPGLVLADHSTVDLSTTRQVHQAALDRGASFLDAPVSGGPEGAAEATLSIMCGGDAAAFAAARPALEAMGRTVVHMGPSGAGTASKLANQLLVGAHTLAAAEALSVARGAGVDLERLLPLLERSWGQSRILERNGPRFIRGDFGPSAAPLRNLLKDLGIIEELGRSLGLALPAVGAARKALAAAAAGGRESWDIGAAALALTGGRESP